MTLSHQLSIYTFFNFIQISPKSIHTSVTASVSISGICTRIVSIAIVDIHSFSYKVRFSDYGLVSSCLWGYCILLRALFDIKLKSFSCTCKIFRLGGCRDFMWKRILLRVTLLKELFALVPMIFVIMCPIYYQLYYPLCDSTSYIMSNTHQTRK